jgi:DNA-binding GntR family transcriptional regulator
MIVENNPAWLERLQGTPLPVLLTLHGRGRLDETQLARATGFKPLALRQALLLLETYDLVTALPGDRWVITAFGDAVVAQLRRRRAGR